MLKFVIVAYLVTVVLAEVIPLNVESLETAESANPDPQFG